MSTFFYISFLNICYNLIYYMAILLEWINSIVKGQWFFPTTDLLMPTQSHPGKRRADLTSWQHVLVVVIFRKSPVVRVYSTVDADRSYANDLYLEAKNNSSKPVGSPSTANTVRKFLCITHHCQSENRATGCGPWADCPSYYANMNSKKGSTAEDAFQVWIMTLCIIGKSG